MFAFAFPYKVVALLLNVYELLAAVPVVAPLLVFQPTDVYPVFAVILGNVTLQLVDDVVTLQLSLVEPIELTFAPFEYVTLNV